MTEANLKAAELEGLEKRFKLSTTMSTGNMVCFDLNGKIRKYASAEEILHDFFNKRLEYYGLRKVRTLVARQESDRVLILVATPRRRAQQAI